MTKDSGNIIKGVRTYSVKLEQSRSNRVVRIFDLLHDLAGITLVQMIVGYIITAFMDGYLVIHNAL